MQDGPRKACRLGRNKILRGIDTGNLKHDPGQTAGSQRLGIRLAIKADKLRLQGNYRRHIAAQNRVAQRQPIAALPWIYRQL